MRGLTIFLVTFVALLAAATTFTGRYNAQCLGSDKLDLPPGRVLVTSGLRDADTVLLKLRLIDNIKRPDVGIFGNHVVAKMTADDVTSTLGPKATFYNFGLPHVTTEEMIEYLTYVARRGLMPKIVLIGITDPNHGNGEHILGYQWKMHNDIYIAGSSFSGNSLRENLSLLMTKVDRWFVDHIDFQSFLHAVSNAMSNVCSAGNRYLDVEEGRRRPMIEGRQVSMDGFIGVVAKLLPKSIVAGAGVHDFRQRLFP